MLEKFPSIKKKINYCILFLSLLINSTVVIPITAPPLITEIKIINSKRNPPPI